MCIEESCMISSLSSMRIVVATTLKNHICTVSTIRSFMVLYTVSIATSRCFIVLCIVSIQLESSQYWNCLVIWL